MISRKTRIVLLLLSAIAVTGCATAHRAADNVSRCAVSFICADPGKISVSVDGGRLVLLRSLDAVRYNKTREMRRTKKNTLWLSSGIHNIKVERDGRTIYEQKINMTSAVYILIGLPRTGTEISN